MKDAQRPERGVWSWETGNNSVGLEMRQVRSRGYEETRDRTEAQVRASLGEHMSDFDFG